MTTVTEEEVERVMKRTGLSRENAASAAVAEKSAYGDVLSAGAEEKAASEWSHEEGPRGGDRWVSGDGDVRYTEPAGWEGGDGEPDYEEATYGQLVQAVDDALGRHMRRTFQDAADDADEMRELLEEMEDWKRRGVEHTLGPDEFHGTEHESEVAAETDLEGMAPGAQAAVVEAVDEAAEEHGVPPEAVREVTTDPKSSDGSMANAVYYKDDAAIYVNPQTASENFRDEARDDHVADDIQEVMMHELVHAKHHHETGFDVRELTDDERELLEEGASPYAATEAVEAVAEIGLMRMKGEEPPDELMDIYRDLGGPEL